MRLKKANAVCALLAMLALIVHMGYCAFTYITLYYNPTLKTLTAMPFLVCTCAHAAMSIWAVFFQGDGMRLDLYGKQNWRTLVQRIAAALIVLLLIVHLKAFGVLKDSAANGTWGVFALVMAAQCVFYAVIAAHVALSFSRALITLGFLSSREAQRKLDRLITILCVAAMIVCALAVIRGQLLMFLSN